MPSRALAAPDQKPKNLRASELLAIPESMTLSPRGGRGVARVTKRTRCARPREIGDVRPVWHRGRRRRMFCYRTGYGRLVSGNKSDPVGLILCPINYPGT